MALRVAAARLALATSRAATSGSTTLLTARGFAAAAEKSSGGVSLCAGFDALLLPPAVVRRVMHIKLQSPATSVASVGYLSLSSPQCGTGGDLGATAHVVRRHLSPLHLAAASHWGAGECSHGGDL